MPKSILQVKVDSISTSGLFGVKAIPAERGDQIIYVPNHLTNDIRFHTKWHYPNGIQTGFIYSITPEGQFFIRYWHWDYKRENFVPVLRTRANSELTPSENLFYFKFFKDSDVTRAFLEITKETK